MSAATSSNPKSPLAKLQTLRPAMRFGLRTLFVVLTVGCVALGWIANRAQRQQRAVATIKSLGGEAVYEHETIYSDEQHPFTPDPPPGPPWLRERLGIDYFDNVVKFRVGRDFGIEPSPANDDHLALLRGLPNVRDLGFCRSNISDKGCLHLATLPRLEVLYLDDTQVTDAVLALKQA